MAYANPPIGWVHTWLKPLYDWLVGLVSLVNQFTSGEPAFEVDANIASNLAGYTYANGTLGVGATLTAGSNAAFSTQDGVAAVLNNTYMVSGQSSTFQNGLYKLTTLGNGSTAAVLTRVTGYDQSAEMKRGTLIGIRSGTLYGGAQYEQTSADNPVVGTDAITFAAPANYVTTDTTQTVSGAKTFSAGLVGVGILATGAPQALSGAGAVNVTTFATLFTSTGAAQALTIADGSKAGQLKLIQHTVDGGSGVLTPATAGNFATFTFTNVHDAVLLQWSGSAWNVLMNTGGTVA